jgi:hypothetical protein
MALTGAFAWAGIPLLPVTFRNTKVAHTQDTANEQPEYTYQLACGALTSTTLLKNHARSAGKKQRWISPRPTANNQV